MPVAGPGQTPEAASESDGGNDAADVENDEETVRRAQRRIREQSRPRSTVGSDAPEANPETDIEADAERRRQETNAEANRAARGGDRPTGPTGPDETPEPASGGTGGRTSGGDGDAPTTETGGGRDGSRPTGPTGPDETPDPAPDDDQEPTGGRGGSQPTGPTGPDQTPDPAPEPDPEPDPEPPTRDRQQPSRDRPRRGDRPTGFTRPEQTPDPDPFPDRQGTEVGSGALSEQASALERRAIETIEGIDDPAKVRVVRRGDRLVARLTEEGRESLAEQRSREVAAAVAPAAAAVAADPGRGRVDPNQEVAAMSDALDEASATTRQPVQQDEQFGDFRVGIPFTDRTFEGVTRDAAADYREATADIAPDRILLPTGAGSVSVSTESNPVGRFAAGELEGVAALGNVPAAAQGVDEAFETAGFLAYETAEGRGGDATEDLGQAAQVAAAEAIESAQADPFGVGGQTAGSLVASAGIIGGASRVSSTAGRAAAYGIQPGEELASAGLSRAFPGVASRFPGGRIDNEEIVLQQVQRAGGRIRSAFRSNAGSQRVMADGGMNIPRGSDRGQLQLTGPSLETETDLMDVEIAGTEPVPGRTPSQSISSVEDIAGSGGRAGPQGRGVGQRGRQGGRGPPGDPAREFAGYGARADESRRILEQERERIERAQKSQVEVAEELVGERERTELASEVGVIETESAREVAGEIGRLEAAQQPSAREQTALRTDAAALAQELGVVSDARPDAAVEPVTETDLATDPVSEFDVGLESETGTEAELERDFAREVGLELDTETEQEFELESFVELEQEFESEVFGRRRDRRREEETESEFETGRRLLEFDVAGFEEVLGR